MDISCVFVFLWPFFVQPLPSRTKIYQGTHLQHIHTLVASALCCGEVGALCKKLSVLQQLGVRAMKQQGLGLLYCLSVVLWASVQL